ncbi:MAG: Cyclic nucleotide-binding protein [Chloroflexi bacterium]|nr:Cyclic nucleotide-binding protein [Chloroflexota bacterium]
MPSKYSEILRRAEIFENVSEADLDKIGDLLKERRYRENQVLFKQGDPGDALFLVADGRIKVSIQDGAEERVLAFYGANQVLGEMALLTGEPRSAAAMAVSDTRVLALPKQDFDTYLSGNVAVMREMMRIISIRQTMTNERLTRGGAENDVQVPSKTGKVYTVFSPRGGSGKSMLAVNLAVAFAQMHPDQVTLMDLSLTFGHAALMLNLAPKASLAGITLDSLSRIDREGMSYYLAPHASTLKVLVGSAKPEEGESVTGDHAKAAIDILKGMNAITVIDTASNFSEASLAALEAADKVLLVCTPELTTLRDVRECQRIFTDLIHLPTDRVYYVMNQLFPYKVLGVEQFEQALEQQMNVEIPYANDVPAKAAVRGEAFMQTQPGSNIAKAIEKIAKTLDDEASPQKAKQQPEKRSGLFGLR